MVFIARLVNNRSIAIMSPGARIFQAGIVHFAHDMPYENLSCSRLKYHAGMVTYFRFNPLRLAWR